MSQHFLERSEPPTSATCSRRGRPALRVGVAKSSSSSSQRTADKSPKNGFVSLASIASLRCDLRRYDRYPTRVRLRCDLCARVRLPAQGAYHRPSLELSSVQVISSYCASMNQAKKLQPASTRSMQISNTPLYRGECVRAECVR